MLELIHVTKDYPSPGRAGSFTVLKDITLKVSGGESLAVVGPSGSGKSTLLNIIGALDRPSRGKVLLDGNDLGKLGDSALAKLRSGRIGFVFQLHHLLPQCTVLENVLLPTIAAGNSKLRKQARTRAAEFLERVGLTGLENHRPGELSGGQRQRAAVVRALINKPELLLADEPTGSLDADSAEDISDLLVELNRSEQVTLIVVTHWAQLAEKMGKVLYLGDGCLKERTNSA
jgi:ABC-type lipoprotein export system ATPase subunit